MKNPILYLIYQFLKLLVKTSFRIFFARSTVINRQHFKVSKPCILVSNHPSTLIDPLNVAKQVPAVVFFLANASLFKHPLVDWLLNTFYCIPVERPQDVEGRRISNADNFKRADNFLKKGGVLYIAPEGTSVMEKALRRVKTGTARIALSAESKNEYQLGLTILPVGLTYSSPTKFRSKNVVYAGEPIKVADYADLHREDPIEAVKSLTADLQERMSDLIYNVRAQEEVLIDKVETILNNEFPLSEEAQFFRTNTMVDRMRMWKDKDKESFNEIFDKLKGYFAKLEQWKINDEAVMNLKQVRVSAVDILKLIFGIPFFVYGWLNNILPCILPAYLANTLKLYAGYQSTVKILSGIITFPIFYSLQIWLVQHFFENGVLTVIYGLSLLPMGWLAWEYRKFARQYLKNKRAAKLREKAKLLSIRKVLVKKLNSLLTSSIQPSKT